MSGPEILCIDDTDSVLTMMRVILKRAGHEVYTARSGECGLRKLDRLPGVEVVVTNYMMPRMSGLDVVSYLADDPRYDDLGVVFHTAGLNLANCQIHPSWRRVDVCLRAPFQPGDLLEAINQAHAAHHAGAYT